MTEESIAALVAEIEYKDWSIRALPHHGTLYLRVSFERGDQLHVGRRWPLSLHMTKSEIVQTALLAVLTAEEHETREAFHFRGRAVFGPHFDCELLVTLCDAGVLDLRDPVPHNQVECLEAAASRSSA